MIIQEKKITLKNGQNIILRSPGAENTEAIIHHIQIASGGTHFMTRYPKGFTMTVEKERAFLERLTEDKNDFMISALIDNRLVANADVQKVQNLIKFRYHAGFGISIREEICSLSLDTVILQETIAQAQNTSFGQLELEVFSNSPRVRHLYEKMGFQETGTRLRACKLKDGTYQGEVQMVCYLP